MSWSLDFQASQEPELLDEFLLAMGKALYLACGFEAKCRWVLQLYVMAEKLEAGGDWQAVQALGRALKDKQLGGAIKGLEKFPEVLPNDIALLDRAREARNAIAHAIAELGPVSGISARILAERTETLREEVAALIAGDNLVSCWCYEITEKEHAPREIQELYPEWVADWLWGHIGA
jgi:hypothetical protein